MHRVLQSSFLSPARTLTAAPRPAPRPRRVAPRPAQARTLTLPSSGISETRGPLPDFVTAPLYGTASPFKRINADAEQVRQGTLHPLSMSFYSPVTKGKPKGEVLLYHGFAAGPFEFHEWAKALNDAGLAVYAVRAPGHGEQHKNGWRNSDALPSLSHGHGAYARFVEEVTQEAVAHAAAQGLPLLVGGFSMGGAMAMHTAALAPKAVQKLVLIAPLVRPGHEITRALYARVKAAHDIPWVRNVVDHMPAVPLAVRMGRGNDPFPLNRAYEAVDYAADVQKTLHKLPETLLIGSKSDLTTDWLEAARVVLELAPQSNVHMFERSEHVAHSMVGPLENPDIRSRKAIEGWVVPFLAGQRSQCELWSSSSTPCTSVQAPSLSTAS